jgi:hypothetical protein
MPGFLEDADLQASMDSILKPEPGSFQPSWIGQAIIDANLEAYGIILRVLARRGFSPAQIAGWYMGPTIQRKLGIFRACVTLISCSVLAATAVNLQPFDVEKVLLTIDLTDNAGNLILPTLPPNGPNGPGPGIIVSGVMQVLPTETFRSANIPSTPDNPLQFRRGIGGGGPGGRGWWGW